MEMKPKYDPREVEAGRYEEWVKNGYFKPSEDKSKETYTIVIPPPNVTGKLHLGHAWDTTLQDIITRMKRMQGYDTLYLPGMDHAGIATQAKVEAKLNEQGITRYDLGREKFLEQAWDWKEEYASFIRAQWAKLGLGLDYSRERFTLDEGLSKAVKKVFVDLYNKGIIYRGERIINWDPKARTALFLATGSTGSSPGHDLRYSTEKVESVWNFINKIWNGARFSLMNIGEDFKVEDIDLSGNLSLADKWILTRLNETIATVTDLSDKYEFGEVGRALYNFIWDDFCDWYIEMSKIPMNSNDEEQKQVTRSVLSYTLDNIMRMLHPFMPFVTEKIWQSLPHEGDTIVKASWPEVRESLIFEESKQTMQQLVEIIKSVRQSRVEVNTPLSKEIPILIQAKDKEIETTLSQNKDYLIKFCNPSTLNISTDVEIPEKAMTSVVIAGKVVLPLEGLIDMDKEISRLEKELAKLQSELDRVDKKLSNENFVSKAPEKVINEEKRKKQDYQEKYDGVKARIEQLKA
ncbi:class I tRNA ligase family protein [Staphylococcus aureus]|uniref:class I tRNA ligase family protein n=1 Tax=Staphylococcus aureus TaxID=1280 RepID=UPI0021C38AA6|nr:class I tRNA ligase family protein [Staphylococcus aureus]